MIIDAVCGFQPQADHRLSRTPNNHLKINSVVSTEPYQWIEIAVQEAMEEKMPFIWVICGSIRMNYSTRICPARWFVDFHNSRGTRKIKMKSEETRTIVQVIPYFSKPTKGVFFLCTDMNPFPFTTSKLWSEIMKRILTSRNTYLDLIIWLYCIFVR